MRYSITVKFIAVVLCAFALLAAVGSGLGLIVLGAADLLGGRTPQEVRSERAGDHERVMAEYVADFWLAENMGGMPEWLAEEHIRQFIDNWYDSDYVHFDIIDPDTGDSLDNRYDGQPYDHASVFDIRNLSYRRYLGIEVRPVYAEDEDYDIDYMDARGWYQDADGMAAAVPDNARWTSIYSASYGNVSYWYAVERAPVITVILYIEPEAIQSEPEWNMLTQLWLLRHQLAYILAAGVLVFAILAVYLCCSAGHAPKTETLRPSGLNRLPLDLYAGGTVFALCMAAMLTDELELWLVRQTFRTMLLYAGGVGYACCVVFVGFCFAFAAQVKVPGGYWWWNSLCGRCLKLALFLLKKLTVFARWALQLGARLLRWAYTVLCRMGRRLMAFVRRMLPAMAALAQKLWKALHQLVTGLLGWVFSLLRRIGRRLERFFARLPLTWQWILTGSVLMGILLFAFESGQARAAILAAAIGFGLVFYGADCYGRLLEAVKQMRMGNLETKVDESFLVGSFRDFAGELNGLADVAIVAAQKQMKSERMKTELITNVSHDIKTPLTSIINYVDLLTKPHTPEEEQTYLEVLSRQSGRMKKLIEDLIEMSKANTGNIPVEIARVDAVETVNQALGEFSDKLTNAGLTPIFRQPEQPVEIMADGRLVWRAMSNLLSNAVKYAMPGTRLYVDIVPTGEKVLISFKNISGAPLNISADELLERFVRGDASRNTEGSGLGLNIAKSLMELQKGGLELLVDGDLFKATLVFIRAQENRLTD